MCNTARQSYDITECTAGTTIKNKLLTSFWCNLMKTQDCCKAVARQARCLHSNILPVNTVKTTTVHEIRLQWLCPLLHSCTKNAAKRTTIDEVHMTDAQPHPDSLANLHCHLATALHMNVRELSQHCTAALSFTKIHMRYAILFAICNMARHPTENHTAR